MEVQFQRALRSFSMSLKASYRAADCGGKSAASRVETRYQKPGINLYETYNFIALEWRLEFHFKWLRRGSFRATDGGIDHNWKQSLIRCFVTLYSSPSAEAHEGSSWKSEISGEKSRRRDWSTIWNGFQSATIDVARVGDLKQQWNKIPATSTPAEARIDCAHAAIHLSSLTLSPALRGIPNRYVNIKCFGSKNRSAGERTSINDSRYGLHPPFSPVTRSTLSDHCATMSNYAYSPMQSRTLHHLPRNHRQFPAQSVEDEKTREMC